MRKKGLETYKFGDDVCQGALDLGNDDVLDGVDTTIRYLDHLKSD
jgi:hypothetical protein